VRERPVVIVVAEAKRETSSAATKATINNIPSSRKQQQQPLHQLTTTAIHNSGSHEQANILFWDKGTKAEAVATIAQAWSRSSSKEESPP
jgi:hypothetical protein